MNIGSVSDKTILQRRKKTSVKFSDQETLLLLRAYETHPCSWNDITESIKVNLHSLPLDAQELFNTCSTKQIRERLCTKLGEMMKLNMDGIKNQDIRLAVQKVKNMENKLVNSKCSAKPTMLSKPTTSGNACVVELQPTPSEDRRDEEIKNISNDESESEKRSTKRKRDESDEQSAKKLKKKKRPSVMDLYDIINRHTVISLKKYQSFCVHLV